MLSQDEAFRFIVDVLKFDDRHAREKLKWRRLLFLEELIQAYQAKIPFHNVNLLNLSPEQRHVPTWEEIKADMMQERGGLCYTLSVFMKFLLDALEFKTAFLAGAVRVSTDNHIATVVFDLTENGSRHLVDPTAYPTFVAIPLDFEVESPIYEHSFLQYKFVKKDDIVYRLHRRRVSSSTNSSCGAVLNQLPDDQWIQVCELNLTPRELSYFQPFMHTVFTVPGKNSPFLVNFRVVLFADLKLVAFKNNILLLEKEDHSLEEVAMASREEMIETVLKYFPQFTEAKVAKAVDFLDLFPIK